MINIEDFQKLDIRIGTVTHAEIPHWSRGVIKLEVDFGEFGKRNIFAKLLDFYKPADLEGKQLPFIVNLQPKKIGPEKDLSQGMILAAVVRLENPIKHKGVEEQGKPVLIVPLEKVPNGTSVS